MEDRPETKREDLVPIYTRYIAYDENGIVEDRLMVLAYYCRKVTVDCYETVSSSPLDGKSFIKTKSY